MKIAFASDDGKTISAHFGHAPCFVVVTVHDGIIVERELRQSGSGTAHNHETGACHRDKSENAACGCHSGGDIFRGCEAVVSLGMGPRAATQLQQHGIRPVILAEPMEIEAAALAIATGGAAEKPEGASCCCHGN